MQLNDNQVDMRCYNTDYYRSTTYEVAWKDFNDVTSHLVNDGFILLDDSACGQNFGSAQMMHSIKKDKRFKVIAKKTNYLIQKIGNL